MVINILIMKNKDFTNETQEILIWKKRIIWVVIFLLPIIAKLFNIEITTEDTDLIIQLVWWIITLIWIYFKLKRINAKEQNKNK